MAANNALHIAVLAGDGIGPEVMAPALEVLRKVGAKSDLELGFSEAPAGASYCRETGRWMPDSTVRLCEEARSCWGALRAAVGALPRQHRDYAAG